MAGLKSPNTTQYNARQGVSITFIIQEPQYTYTYMYMYIPWLGGGVFQSVGHCGIDPPVVPLDHTVMTSL